MSSKCCYHCRYRRYRNEDMPCDDMTPLPNAVEDLGEWAKNLLVPANDDNPAFLMRSTDGQIRRFHGRYNECMHEDSPMFGKNLDKSAQARIDQLLSSGDYIMEKGTIYSTALDYSFSASPRNIYEPSDLVLRDYYRSRYGLSDTTTIRKVFHGTISQIINEFLFSQGQKCKFFRDRRNKPIRERNIETIEVKGRKIQVVRKGK